MDPRTPDSPVLVVTELDDPTADMVIADLNDRQVPVVRFDPADFGEGLQMSTRLDDTQPTPVGGLLETLTRSVSLEGIRSVYWRRPTWPTFDHLDRPDARYASAQVRHGLGGSLYALPALHVNHPLRTQAADFKPAQLALARQLGLRIPATLISNRILDIRAFIDAHPDGVVYKTLRWTPYRIGDEGRSTWTEPVAIEELDPSVIVTPHLFQARIAKIADVRVTVVGETVFAVRIDSDLLDWRADYDALSYSIIDLPGQLEKQLRAYLERCGLIFGCFDLAIDAGGDYVWIELNPNGQWGWLEDEAGVPLTAAFADILERGAQ